MSASRRPRPTHPGPSRTAGGQRFWVVFAAALLVLAGGLAVAALGSRGGRSPALRGKELAERFGCFACHGPEGTGGVADPLAPGGEIPDWRYETVKLFASSTAEIRRWITHGWSPQEEQRDPAGQHTSIAPMPAYRHLLTEQECDDLLAYVLAVSGWRPSYSEAEHQGRVLALRLGCFGCHGPSGIGGVPDPGSASGFVPPLVAGPGKPALDEDQLRHWILEGSGKPPRTRAGARGMTPMPAYHDHLSDSELEELVRYLRSLDAGSSNTHGDDEAAEVIG